MRRRALSNEVLQTHNQDLGHLLGRIMAMVNGWAPGEIATAIIDENLDVVKAWLDAGGDPNAKSHPASGAFDDVPHWSLLSLAASGGNVEIISLFCRGARTSIVRMRMEGPPYTYASITCTKRAWQQ